MVRLLKQKLLPPLISRVCLNYVVVCLDSCVHKFSEVGQTDRQAETDRQVDVEAGSR